MAAVFDPYGSEYGNWEDPHVHILLGQCAGCVTCAGWRGKTVNEICAERAAFVCRRRGHARPEQTAAEVAAEDRAYWDDRYA